MHAKQIEFKCYLFRSAFGSGHRVLRGLVIQPWPSSVIIFVSLILECPSLALLWVSWQVLAKDLRVWVWVHVVYIEG